MIVLTGVLVASSLGATSPSSAGLDRSGASSSTERDAGEPAGIGNHDGEGSVLRAKVRSKALEGNLAGDSAVRDVSIYLPPGYNEDRPRRYPVLYMLHGFTETDLSYFSPDARTNVPASADRTMSGGDVRDMIIVTPNAMTVFGGSNYSSGANTGDWETFISDELVSYVDTRFRTVRSRDGRGIAGHSMGGYGALRIGMKHSDVFSAMYVLSSCCISSTSNIPNTPEQIEALENFNTMPEDYTEIPRLIRTRVAAAASWAPNPENPPLYFDKVYEDGVFQESVFERMVANRPLAMVDQYISSLRTQKIAFDVGDQDRNIARNLTELDRILTAYDVPHIFEVYEGTHGNRIPERFEENVLPFFSERLRHAGG